MSILPLKNFLVILLNLKKIATKWENFTNVLKPQNKNKKPWWVGVLPLDSR
jgi:hypothetical protein